MGRRRPTGFIRRVMGLEALERVEARRRASAAEPAEAGGAPLEDLRLRMAELAASIRQLELRAQEISARAALAADGTGAAASADAGAQPQEQLEMIDALLESVRTLRAALDQQRAELAVAEDRVEDAEREQSPRHADDAGVHGNGGDG